MIPGMKPSSSKPSLNQISNRALAMFEFGGLVIITIATLIAGLQEVLRMIGEAHVNLADLLLLFIYLEVLAMVAIYHQSGSLPVRMPLYIAIVALARHMILDMKKMSETEILATAAAALIIALAVMALRFSHFRFSSADTSPGTHTPQPPPAREGHGK